MYVLANLPTLKNVQAKAKKLKTVAYQTVNSPNGQSGPNVALIRVMPAPSFTKPRLDLETAVI